jgi:tRNA-dihydrouridine synthase B
MRIGCIQLDNPTILAPLAGYTHLPFRLIVKEAGCGLVCSEMVSASGLVYGSKKTAQLLDTHPAEKPLSVQIFGATPDIMARAAVMVEASGADIIDINFGCSVKKVIKTGSGVALMKEPKQTAKILTAVRQAVTIPLTIKMRSGWDISGDQAIHTAKIAQDCGVDAVCVHPRTATQRFKGHAAWPVIAAVKNAVTIPVIGNGDILTPDDAARMQNETGCDAVMIGRAAMGNPLIFSQIHARLKGDEILPVTVRQHFEFMEKFLMASANYFGETRTCFIMRSRLGPFVKGLPAAKQFRESIKQLTSVRQAQDIMRAYEKSLESRDEALDRARA